MRAAVTETGFSIRELQNELDKLHGKNPTAGKINLDADKAAEAVRKKMLELSTKADETGNRKSSTYKEAIANLKEMLDLIEKIRGAKLDEAVNAPAKATAEKTQAVIEQLKGMLDAEGHLKHVSHAQAEADKLTAEAERSGAPLSAPDRIALSQQVGRVNTAEVHEAIDKFIEAIQEGGRKDISPQRRAMEQHFRELQASGHTVTQQEKDRAETAVRRAEKETEKEGLKAEAKRMLEGAMTADEKRAATIARLDEMLGREIITRAQRQKIIDAMNPQSRFEAHGTFNAMAMLGLQAGGHQERIANATEKTAKNTDKLVSKVNDNALAFA